MTTLCDSSVKLLAKETILSYERKSSLGWNWLLVLVMVTHRSERVDTKVQRSQFGKAPERPWCNVGDAVSTQIQLL